MKKSILFLLLLTLCLTAVCFIASADSSITLSFADQKLDVNGGATVKIKVNASPAPQEDLSFTVQDDSGKTYKGVIKANKESGTVKIKTKTVKKAQTLTLTFTAADGIKTRGNTKFTLRTLPLPKLTIPGRVNIGYVGKKMTVKVSCSNMGNVAAGSNVFELRDHNGLVLSRHSWRGNGSSMSFTFDATKELEGRHDLSVWLAGQCVSNTAFGTIADVSVMPLQTIDTKEPCMSITIDCNWYNGHSKEILDVLDKYNVKATFFMTGNYFRLFPDTVKKIVSKGHEIGNHSNTHMRQTKNGDYTRFVEIAKPIEEAEALLGIRPRLFRPPYGDFDKVTTAIARGMGMEVCLWTIDSHDWDLKFQSKPEQIIRRVKKNVVPGTIILFHMDGYNTAQVLDTVIPYYQNELGMTCVKVTELMALEGRELPPLPEGDVRLIKYRGK